MRKLFVATSNAHKLDEMRSIVSDDWQLVGMHEAGFRGDIDEDGETLEENAYLKARALFDHLGGGWVIGEDTGLEVDALDGRPGARTARFAGEGATAQENMAKLLHLLKGASDRSAQFRTVITLIDPHGKVHYFEGICRGRIAEQPMGMGGFGYDPIFIPEGYEKSFAALPAEVKNRISHRARALAELRDFIRHLEEKPAP